jgi:putative thiamine transport system ATP-binding protein
MSDDLTLEGISLKVAGRCLIEDLNLSIPAGEVLTIMGPSGAGKSSLIAYLGGFLEPSFSSSGRASLGGVVFTELPAERRHLGILFQDDLLFPHLSVGENLAFGLRRHVTSRHQRRATIESALAEADLGGFADRDPATLSGGQRSRVALLRTLLAAPRALLLDEPFSRLDALLRSDVRDFVFSRARALMLPVLLVTHDRDDAAAAHGRLVEIGAALPSSNRPAVPWR